MVDVECGHTGCDTSGAENIACDPIAVSADDPDFGQWPCLMFVRTIEVPRHDCRMCKYHWYSFLYR